MTVRAAVMNASPALLTLALIAGGCVLDDSEKQACERQADCVDGYTCTNDNVCIETINLGPDASSLSSDASFEPAPDAAVYDPDAYEPIPDAARYDPDAYEPSPDAWYDPDAYEPSPDAARPAD